MARARLVAYGLSTTGKGYGRLQRKLYPLSALIVRYQGQTTWVPLPDILAYDSALRATGVPGRQFGRLTESERMGLFRTTTGEYAGLLGSESRRRVTASYSANRIAVA